METLSYIQECIICKINDEKKAYSYEIVDSSEKHLNKMINRATNQELS